MKLLFKVESSCLVSWRGMEGMKAFKDPSELLNQSIWQEARMKKEFQDKFTF